MQTNNLRFVLEQAQDKRQKAPIAGAVRDAVDTGQVEPSVLRSKLKAAGLKVITDEAGIAKYGFAPLSHLQRVLVVDKTGLLVAMGASYDHDDALLHAMLGWFRENPLDDAIVPEGLGTVPAGT